MSSGRSAGIAVVSTLLVALLVLALGAGALFLTNSTLRTAASVRDGAQARLSAESGLQLALAELREAYEADGEVPDAQAFDLPRITVDGAPLRFGARDDQALYAVASQAGGERVTVEVVGRAGATSAFFSQAVADVGASGRPGDPSVASAIARGVTARRTVTMNGSPILIDAGLHGNRGYTLNGFRSTSFKACQLRLPNGVCQSYAPAAGPPFPASAARGESSYTCNVSPANPDLCDGGPTTLVDDPFVGPDGEELFTVEYDGLRDGILCELANGGACDDATQDGYAWTGFAAGNPVCDVVYGRAPRLNKARDVRRAGFLPGRTVCVDGSVSFPNKSDLTGVNVVVNGSVNFNGGRSTVDDTVLVTFDGGINMNARSVSNSRLFSEGPLNYNGRPTFEGTTTLATGSDVTFNGSTRNNDGVSRLAVLAEGSIRFNGSADTWGTFVSGGDFTQNGSSRIYGGVVARGTARFNGSMIIDSGVDIANPDLPDDPGDAGSAGFEVVSVR